MIMCRNCNNVTSYPISDRKMDIGIPRDLSSYALISFEFGKVVRKLNPKLRYYCNCEVEQ